MRRRLRRHQGNTRNKRGYVSNSVASKRSRKWSLTGSSPEQLHDLLVLRTTKETEVPGSAPEIAAIVFGCPIAIVAVVLFYRYRKNAMLHRTLALMVERGTPIPPELLTLEPKKNPSDLRRDVILVMTGPGHRVVLRHPA